MGDCALNKPKFNLATIILSKAMEGVAIEGSGQGRVWHCVFEFTKKHTQLGVS